VRLVVGVGHFLAPGGLRSVRVVTIYEAEVGHEAVRGGAMPVLLAWSGVDGVAGSGFNDVAVAAAEQGDAVADEQGLAQAVGYQCEREPGANRTRLRRARPA
jgi:hypothetical protein